MRFENNNKRVIKKLTKRNLKQNKSRNKIAILAIALTTILFTCVFTIGMGLIKSAEMQKMKENRGSYAHGYFIRLTKEQLDKIEKHPLIKDIGYGINVSTADNKELLKHTSLIAYSTDREAKMKFSSPSTGNMPKKENEIATDTLILDLLGVKHKVGEKLKLEYNLDGKKISSEFILSGFWQSDKAMRVSNIFVSSNFINKHLNEIIKNSKNIFNTKKVISASVIFKNRFNIEKKMKKVIKDSGFSLDKNSSNYIDMSVNSYYSNKKAGIDFETLVPMLIISLLVILSGYFIIYNIFEISVARDIKFYGLLKTIGTTSKQIKKIITKQIWLLAAIGIPIGLLAGYLIGNILLPIIVSSGEIKTSYISYNPFIFFGSVIFSFITVYISCRKPGKVAANVSPVQAVRYVDVTSKSKKVRKSLRGGKIRNMAFYNILRNKKKTILVILSLSLSVILFNSIYTIVNGISKDKMLKQSIKTDFVAGNESYFNVTKGFHQKQDIISEKMIKSINNLNGIKDSGRIYYDSQRASKIESKDMSMQLYGFDEFPLSQLDITEGKIDLNKFKTGNYIVAQETFIDNLGNRKRYQHKIGDKITIKFNNVKKEYIIMAKAKIHNSMDCRYHFGRSISMILPSSEFTSNIKESLTMNYVFNVDNKYLDETEKFMQNYTKNIESNMDYESKLKVMNKFQKFYDVFVLVSGALILIIAIIGIINFINSIITSIISRKMEFAMLQSIGMTKKQLRKMIVYEGIFHATITIIFSFIVGSFISMFVLKALSKKVWFLEYKFTILPNIMAIPILLLIAIIVPTIILNRLKKQSIVERLRQVDIV